MYTLIRSLTVRRLLMEQLPAITISMIIAELFYKFHSFVLEGIAFMFTWLVVDAMIQFIARLLRPRAEEISAQDI
jgi:hypothetical protein